jgi:hypothetical protein
MKMFGLSEESVVKLEIDVLLWCSVWGMSERDLSWVSVFIKEGSTELMHSRLVKVVTEYFEESVSSLFDDLEVVYKSKDEGSERLRSELIGQIGYLSLLKR